jgi:RpiB/LacA/LacB family sugar-phosphate isomerase
MRIIIGADHAGFHLKTILAAYLRTRGHEVIDVGTASDDPVDYPDFAEEAAKLLLNRRGDRSILLCGSGVGASVAANKIPGIRAGLCHDSYSAHQGVEHDDINMLVLGARVIGVELARDLVERFLEANFNGEERHRQRVEKIKALERRYSKTT